MSRTRARSLVLVNWNGVFYHRYRLDRHVTALEGVNGSGKTTVMVAAYIALMPDKSKLRFSNVGESGAAGSERGVWGRLGTPGHPSYTALEFELPDGESLIAGVHIARGPRPEFELTPFVVTGLERDTPLQDVLLWQQGGEEGVPELTALVEQVAVHGGQVERFSTAKDYFATLFDRGVTPLRLANGDERSKFNELLQTSMSGGISRALTDEFRTFLLRAESGLADTLAQMRANLKACRTTRKQVADARRLQVELGGVFEAGEQMFAAGLFATRERADELRKRLKDATDERDRAREEHDQVQRGLVDDRVRLTDLRSALEAQRRAVEEAEDAYRRTEAANVLAGRIETLCAEGRALARQRAEAAAARQEATEEVDRCREVLESAERVRDEASTGVAEQQKGLELAQRRAHAHRTATEQLAEAAARLERVSIDPTELSDLLGQARARKDAIDIERGALARRVDDADRHRARHAEALTALTTIEDKLAEFQDDPVQDGGGLAVNPAREPAAGPGGYSGRDDLEERGRLALRRLDRLEDRVVRLDAIERALAAARERADRQYRVSEAAEALHISTADELRGALDAAEAAQGRALDQQREAVDAAREAERAAEAADASIGALRARVDDWRDARVRADRLARDFDMPLPDGTAVEALRLRCVDERDRVRDALGRQRMEREATRAEARALARPGGAFPSALLEARDRVVGHLLAEAFEDEPVERAATTQARLGPLAQAIVVDDPHAAARRLADAGVGCDDVWLVEGEAVAHLVEQDDVVHTASGALAVEEAYGVRVSRLPERPTLGQRAREARRRMLEADLDRIEAAIEVDDARRRVLESALEDADSLLRVRDLLDAVDPMPELRAEEQRRARSRAAIDQHRARATEYAEAAARAGVRVAALRDILPDAALLDPPDHAEEFARLDAERVTAVAARTALDALATARRVLGSTADALSHAPLSPASITAERRRLTGLDATRDAIWHAIGALSYVIEHREALAWTDAQAVLDEHHDLLEQLKAQLVGARRSAEEARSRRDTAENTAQAALGALQGIDGDLVAHEQIVADRQAEFDELGVDDASDAALVAVRQRRDGAIRQVETLEPEERALDKQIAVDESRLGDLRRRLADSEDKIETVRKEADPASERWQTLRGAADAAGLLVAAMAPRYRAQYEKQGNIKARSEAQVRFDVLMERLAGADEGAPLARQLAERVPTGAPKSGELYLDVWREIRAWLMRRLPARFADTADVPGALGRLGEHLTVLQDRLDRHVSDLQSESQSVAGGIDVSIRRARGQIRKLNHGLRDVRFGGVEGIEIKLEREPSMERVFAALKSGEAQVDMFRTDVPIEEAFDEIFRQYGGRRGDGSRLLDYREYLRLEIRIQRRNGGFEVANPSRLSTGEAIGVGASLMMVVLTAWERDANILRRKRSAGTLRFLFLDEANRLSHDSLDVLFDLCRSLELQLLLAAPEVARADGNTTHHLVRRQDAAGRDQVIVTARTVRPAP